MYCHFDYSIAEFCRCVQGQADIVVKSGTDIENKFELLKFGETFVLK